MLNFRRVRGRGFAFRIAFGIILLGVLGPGVADALTLTVCLSGCSYQQIQAAINTSTPGDTIEVRSGTYYENVNVSKQLILRGIDTGTGKPVVDAAGSGNAISLTAPNITIDGFQVINGDAGINADWLSGNITIQNNNASSNKKGIYLLGSKDNLIDNNSAWNNTISGIELESSYYGDIYSCNSNNLTNNTVWNNEIGIHLKGNPFGNFRSSPYFNTVKDNIAYNNKDGILLRYAKNSTIIRNNASNNINFGIKVDALGVCCGGQFIGWGFNNISQNKISYNGNGIYLYSRFDNVTENNILDNSNSGIFIKSLVCGGALFDMCGVESGELTIIQNRVENNGIGIHIDSSRNNTFRSNFILNNNNGLILNDSRNMTIYDNYFMNLNNVIINGTNVWNTTKTAGSNILGGSYLGGNVWAEPDNSGFSQTSPDINGDGICDSGYDLDSNNTDYLPLRIITSNPPISYQSLCQP